MSNSMKMILIGSIFVLFGCSSNHHLVFFTNTTIGVEIASEPASGSPAKFIVGYKRQEGVIDPLIPDYEFIPNDTSANGGVPGGATLAALEQPENGDTSIIMTPQGTAIPKGQNNKAHSVLAKMNFGATGGGSGASASQFFATGLAAELLAKSKGIAGALAGDPEINKVQKEAPYPIKGGKSFNDIIPYIKAMEQSLGHAKKVVIDSSYTYQGAAFSAKEKQEMIDNIESFPAKIKESKDKISSNKAVVSMIDFVYKNILLKAKTK